MYNVIQEVLLLMRKNSFVLVFIIALIFGFLSGYFVAKKTSFSFNNKLTGVWSNGGSYLVVQKDGTFYFVHVASQQIYDEDGYPTSELIYYPYSVSTGHINDDNMAIVYTGRWTSYDTQSMYHKDVTEEEKKLASETPLDQLNYEKYVHNSTISVIDKTTIELGNSTYLKKTDKISMDFRDFIDQQ